MKPSTPEAFRLMMEGSQALTDVEEHGMKIDVEYLDKTIEDTADEIKQLKADLMQEPEYKPWRKRFGSGADVTNRNQLADVLFKDLGYEAKTFSDKSTDDDGNYKAKTDEEAFQHIDLPFLKQWTWMQKLMKCHTTYLVGIRRQTVDGFLHPSFHLHLVKTFRSSSSDPNFQNIPAREPRISKLIRQAFIPRDGYVLVEVDYGALEFRGAACFWKDPGMVAYASDPSLDIHRDMAAECYMLDTDNVSKNARSFAKNKFVFPTLYGSYFKNTGRDLWEAIGRANIETKDRIPLYEHLARRGIDNIDDFTSHVKQVEQRLNERFSLWADEKVKWWNGYLSRGWFPLMTGFTCSGIYSYNFLMNTPIQGSCFHLLLWSLIELNKWLKKHKMKSMIVGQIHDSIRIDVHKTEMQDVLNQVDYVMTQSVRKHWDWVITPLLVEIEASSRNWHEKKPLKFENGRWMKA